MCPFAHENPSCVHFRQFDNVVLLTLAQQERTAIIRWKILKILTMLILFYISISLRPMSTRNALSILKNGRIFLPSRSFYDHRTKHDTIYAPLTAIQPNKGSPLGVIRVSGIKTAQVLSQLTCHNLLRNDYTSIDKSSTKTDKEVLRPRRATLTKIREPITDELIDFGLVLWFPAPNSYSGEDACEFHLHGSTAVITRMLATLGSIPGLRPAEPGEFTRRAVLNGKMSLLQAESLPDLISSQTDYQRKLALKGLDGSTRNKYDSWIKTLVETLAYLEASIDFGEDELIGEQRVVKNCTGRLRQLSDEIHNHIKAGSHCKQFIQNGFRVAILGRPNAGKSTFMNLICRRDKSIVSDLSGTTRDVVEHSFDLGGHAITLCDTAGLKDFSITSTDPTDHSSSPNLLKQHDSVEREGIRRALEVAKNANLILYLVDGSRLTCIDNDSLEAIKEIHDLGHILGHEGNSKVIHLVINKVDLNQSLTISDVGRAQIETSLSKKLVNVTIISFLSCKTLQNFDKFISQLTSHLDKLLVSQSCSGDEYPKLEYVNERHLSLLTSAHRHLVRASQLDLNTIDEMAQHVRESVDYLSRIVGTVSNEQVFDVIFRDFCIGK